MTVVCFERDLSAVALRAPRSAFSLAESAVTRKLVFSQTSDLPLYIADHSPRTSVRCVSFLVQRFLTDQVYLFALLSKMLFDGAGDGRFARARLTTEDNQGHASDRYSRACACGNACLHSEGG